MPTLILDIETVGENWSTIDQQTQEVLKGRIKRNNLEATESEIEDQAINDLGISPLTGEIIAIGLLDYESSKGAVYYQTPNQKVAEEKFNDNIVLRPYTEKEMLEKFWTMAERYNQFVTFSGRAFDIPYIMIRSAIHGIRPSKDLMKGRYLYQQSASAIHIDLYDQLCFYGSFPRLGGLHLACRAFGIETPKDGQIDGSKVSTYFKDGRYKEIAEYNARDILSTRDLYEKWSKYLAF